MLEIVNYGAENIQWAIEFNKKALSRVVWFFNRQIVVINLRKSNKNYNKNIIK